MEDLPATLDDGELWLPSDIFPTDDHDHDQLNHNRTFPLGGVTLEDLSRQFSKINVVHDYRPHIITSNTNVRSYSSHQGLGMFEPMAQYTITAPSPNGSYGLTVDPMVDQGPFNFAQTGPVFPTPNYPAHHFGNVKPAHPWVTELMETRLPTNARTVHTQQQNRFLNRLLPFQASGCRLGYSQTNCRGSATGTGVFIPRADPSSYTGSTYCVSKRNLSGVSIHSDAGKALEYRRVGDCYHHHHQFTSSEVVLPNDWTY